MSVGSSLYKSHKGSIVQLVVRLLGMGDFHTHLRVAPLKRFLRTASFDKGVPEILEIGCGSGINLFELTLVRRFRGIGVDIDPEVISEANRIKVDLGYGHLSFVCGNATNYLPVGEVDCLLLMDVLEHMPRPEEILRYLDGIVKVGGYLIISVPTPNYPKVFGRRFHKEIGHLVEGYDVNDIERMVPGHYRRLLLRRHTGILTWPACFLYYRHIRLIRSRFLRLLLGGLLAPFRWVDVVRGEHTSASLFAVYQKEDNAV